VVFAAWFHSPIGIAVGLVIILAAWTYGLLLMRRAPVVPAIDAGASR
jgi:hypothetical protein